MFEIILCICAFCIDGFCVAISLRSEHIKLPLSGMIVIAFMNALFLTVSICFSSYFLSFIGISKYLGSLVYLFIGIYAYLSYRLRGNDKSDRFIDTLKQKVRIKDALMLGLLLSFDSLVSGLVLVHKNYPFVLYFGLDFIFSIISLILGSIIGMKLANWKNFESEKLTSGIFIILALLKLF